MSDKVELIEMPAAHGIMKRSGWIKTAEFDDFVEELKVRRGKLTAKSGGIWHIVPSLSKAKSQQEGETE